MRPLRRHMMMIFQDPYSSLNPRLTVGAIVAEPLGVYKVGASGGTRRTRVELLRLVGLNPSFINRYPHEFSGGQRQRIGIARALATSPAFIVADEPISALDVSIQAQVVNLMSDLKAQLGLTYLFDSHDLSMVRYISDRVAVMYLGKIVESPAATSVFDEPAAPLHARVAFCGACAESAPGTPTPSHHLWKATCPVRRIRLQGCHFHPRCPFATEICRQEEPALRTLAVQTRIWWPCHHAEIFSTQRRSQRCAEEKTRRV
jgi:ABC-type oligopeptide transport system ATPase subunit